MTVLNRADLLAEVQAKFPDNSTGLITPAFARQFFSDMVNSACLLAQIDQNITGGFTSTSPVADGGGGTLGNFVADAGLGPFQYGTINSAITITKPTANAGSCQILITNGASAAAPSFSGFSGTSHGDTYATTNGAMFWLTLMGANGTWTYFWKTI